MRCCTCWRTARDLLARPRGSRSEASQRGSSERGHAAQLRDRHAIKNRIAAANLVFGAYDLNGTPSQLLWGDRNLVCRGRSSMVVDNFLPGVPFEQRRDSDISPLYGILTDMPKALFSVGTMDCLIDDSLFMVERWRLAEPGGAGGVSAGVHGFTAYPIGLARKGSQTVRVSCATRSADVMLAALYGRRDFA